MSASRSVLASAVLALAFHAEAATIVWDGGTGGGGTAWLTTNNWAGDVIPGAADIALFTNTGTANGIQINFSASPGGTQQVGQIALVGTTTRTIDNSSTTSNGLLRINGVAGMVVSNGSTNVVLTFRDGTARAMGLQLGGSGQFFVNAGAMVVISNNVVSETGGAQQIVKTGGGTLSMSTNAATYSGGTVVVNGPNSQTAGAVLMHHPQDLGTGDILFSNTASITPLHFSSLIRSATVANNLQLSPSGGGIVTRLLGNNSTGQIVNLSGVISGGNTGQQLRFDGDAAGSQNRFRLSNAGNSFTVARLYLIRGGLVFDSDGALGNANNALALDTTTLNPGTGLIFGNNGITLDAARSVGVISQTRIDVQSFTGTVGGAVSNGAILNKKGFGQLAFDGAISGAGAYSHDEGRTVFNAVNTYSGNTTIHTGAVVIGAAGLLQNSGTVTVQAAGTFDLSAAVASPNVQGTQVVQGFGTVTGNVITAAGARLHAGTAGVPGTLTVNGGLFLDSGNTHTFDLTNSLATGGGVNDLIVVNGDLNPGSSTISINPLAPLVGGTNTLLTYTGTKFTTFNAAVAGNTTRNVLTLDEATAGQIRLIVAASNEVLRWTANTSADWDLGTTNWTVVANGSPDRFFDYDSVLFDDATDSNAVAITTVVRPAAVTVNSTSNYTFDGAGRISSPAGIDATLTKDGPGRLVLLTANDYTGPSVVSNGTLQVGAGGNVGQLGPAMAVVTSPGTLEFFRSNTAFAVNNVIGGNGTVRFSGSGGIQESGYLLGANNAGFAGTLVVATNARITLDNVQDAGAATLIEVQNGGGVFHSAGTFGSPISLAGTGWNENLGRAGALRVENATWSGPVTLATNARIGAINANGTVSGTISGPHELELFNNGTTARSITLAPASPNSYAALRVSGTMVAVAGNQNAYSQGPVIMNGGTQRLAGMSFSFSNLSSTAAGGTIVNNSGNPATFTVGLDGSSTTSSAVFFDGAGGGSMNMTKVGAGTLTLTASNLNTGAFTVQAGTLALGTGGQFNGSASLVLEGGTFDVGAKPVYAPTHAIKGNGTVAGTINPVQASRILPGDLLVAGTITFANDLGMAGTYTNHMDLTDSTGVGGGTNDLIAVTGNLEPSNSVIAINQLRPLVNGTYTLFTYGGAKISSFNTNLAGFPSRKTWTLDETTPNQVNLVVSGGDYAALAWRPTTSAAWDFATTNWINATNAAPERFFNMDSVVFDDAGAYSNIVSLSAPVAPLTLAINSASNYVFAGPGRISGTVGILKAGAGLLTLSNANDFAGDVVISNGIVKVGHSNALGSATGVTIVHDGGTVDLQGQALKNVGERFLLSGAGFGGTGAVVATGANQQDAVRSLTLEADATIASYGTERWDLRGPGGASSFNGELNLRGFTLTKIGLGRVSMIDCTITNDGEIRILGGMLEVSRSLISGDGPIYLAPSTVFYLENYSVGALTKTLVLDGSVVTNTGNDVSVGSPVILSNSSVFTLARHLTLTNVVSGPGALLKTGGASNLTLTANNTYAGGTLVGAGTLFIGIGGTSGSVPGAITNNATVQFARSDSFVLTNSITGSGSLSVNVAGGMTVDASAPIGLGGTILVPNNGPGAMLIRPGASITAANLFLGNTASWPGSVAMDGGSVVIGNGNVRVGHWPTETSTWFMAGGSLTVTNATATNPFGTSEQVGTLYLGIDGAGVFTMTGGVVQCGGLVLDNRGDTTGTDTLALEGGTLSIGRWGIQGNASTLLLLGGGTVSAYADWAGNLPLSLTGTNGPVTFDTSGRTIVLNRVLSGAGGLTKTGDGSLLLMDANSFAGGTTVSGGHLFGTGSVNSAVTVGSGGTLGPEPVVSAAGTFTVGASATFGGGGSFSAFLAGTNPTIRLGGDLTTSPTTFVKVVAAAGVTTGVHVLLDFDGTFNGGIADLQAVVPNGGQGELVHNVGNSSIDLVVTNLGSGIKWDGLVNSAWEQSGPLNWRSTLLGHQTAFSAFDNVLFDDTAPGTYTVSLAEVVSPSSIVVSNDTKGYAWSGGGISGSSGLSKFGAAALAITGSQLSYTGLTDVGGGTLKLESLAGFASPILNASTVELASASGTWDLGTNLDLAGAGTYRKTGAGTVSLRNSSISASGLIAVVEGTLRNDGNGADWNASAASLDVSAGAVFDLRGDATRVTSLSGAGTITNSFGNSALEILRVGAGDTSGDFGGIVQDGGVIGAGEGNGSINFMKIGTGTQVVSGANGLRVNTTVDRGTLQFTADNTAVRALTFGAAPGSTNLPTLDLSQASLTATSFTNLVNSTTTNVIVIGAGRALTINGSVTIGPVQDGARTEQRIVGETFEVVSTNGLMRLAVASGTDNDGRATLDLSAVQRVNLNLGVGSIIVGAGDNNSNAVSRLILGLTNSVVASNLNIGVGSNGSVMDFFLGSVSNHLNVDTFNAGTGSRDRAKVMFATGSGTVVLRDRSGSGRTALNLSRLANDTTGYAGSGFMDFRAHSADLLISTLNIAFAGRNGSTTNTFYFDTGVLDVTGIRMAHLKGSGANMGNLLIGGGVVNVGSGGIILASNAVGNLSISGGVVTVGGSITKGDAGTGTATLTLDGGTLDLQGNVIGGATAIDGLNLLSGTLANVAEVNGGASWSKATTGTLVLAGANLFSSPINVSNGTLRINGTSAGAGQVTVDGGTLGGTGTVGSFFVLVNSGGTLAPGASIGRLALLGDYIQLGALDIELAGTAPGTGHDTLSVGTNATLFGALNVTTNDGFAPASGNTFTVLTASAVSGTFSGVNLPPLDGGLGWSVQYLPAAVVLSVTGGVTPPPSGYDLYALQITNGLTGYQQDADADGYANLLEYVTGGDPTNADQVARMNGARTNGVLALRFTRATNAVDATLYVEGGYAATNNATWADIAINSNGLWSGAAAVTETGASSPVNVTVEDTDPAATNRFLRLRVTRP